MRFAPSSMRRSQRPWYSPAIFLTACTLQRWQPERRPRRSRRSHDADERRGNARAVYVVADGVGKSSGYAGPPREQQRSRGPTRREPASQRMGEDRLGSGLEGIRSWHGLSTPRQAARPLWSWWYTKSSDSRRGSGGSPIKSQLKEFIAIAPDFLSKVRGGPTTVELPGDSAQKLIRGFTTADQAAIIDAAANYAMMLPAAEQRYAVIGYCWGGSATRSHAINGGVMGFSGGVAFYGTPYTGGGQRATATTPAVPATLIADSVAKITKPVLLLSGSKDARITALMPAIDSMMKAMHKSYDYRNYDGAIHGFLRAQDDPKAPGKPTRRPTPRIARKKPRILPPRRTDGRGRSPSSGKTWT